MNFRARTYKSVAAAALATSTLIAFSGVAVADNIQDTIADTGTGVTLTAGSSTTGTAGIRLVGNNSAGDSDSLCNIDAGEAPLVLDLVTPVGVTANPDPLSITACGTDFPVSFNAAANAQSGTVTVTVQSGPAGGGSYLNQVNIPITIVQPAPSNTAPTVAVTGVTANGSYEFGNVPNPMCDVTDAEQPNVADFAATVTGTLSHGLGTLTATCDWSDAGGLKAPTASVSYSIVDTTDPTIGHQLSADPNSNGWFNEPVTATFTCDDPGSSGIASCGVDGDETYTFGHGADQSVTGTATDHGGNTASDTVSGIDVDVNDPEVTLNGADTGTYYYGHNIPAKPMCEATDDLSGLDGACEVSGTGTGGGTGVGTWTWTANATDLAGNTGSSQSVTYTILPRTVRGFYAPVNLGETMFNTVKGGSTVPLKFEVFAGTTEVTDVTKLGATFTATQVTCPGASSMETDPIEVLGDSGATTLRYDTTGGQFIKNWQTPKKAGSCYTVTMTTAEGSTASANFFLK